MNIFEFKNDNVCQKVIHYYFTGWPDYNVIEPHKLIELIQTINKHVDHRCSSRKTSTNQSAMYTLIHCRLFILISKKKTTNSYCMYIFK